MPPERLVHLARVSQITEARRDIDRLRELAKRGGECPTASTASEYFDGRVHGTATASRLNAYRRERARFGETFKP